MYRGDKCSKRLFTVQRVFVLQFTLQVKFDDLFGEPDPEVFSMDSIWSLANKVNDIGL